MLRNVCRATFSLLLCGVMSTASFGQLDGLYEFDAGGDGTSWDDAANWAEILNPDGTPAGGGDPAAPPSPTISADVPSLGLLVVDGTQAGQTALDVSIGTDSGSGSLTITGGDLTARDVFVGSDSNGINIGLLAMTGGDLIAGDDITLGNGSAGIMTMSGGTASTNDDFAINANSSLTVNGGTLTVGDRVVANDNAGIVVDGGSIIADDDFFFFGTSQIAVNSGSMIVKDKMRMDDVGAQTTVNGGLVRSQEFGFVDGDDNYIMNGILEINGSGIYQSEAPGPDSPISQLSVEQAEALIADGTITTSEVFPLGLIVTSVIVPDFFGSADVPFTQISIGRIPEPASALLLGLGAMSLALPRRRS